MRGRLVSVRGMSAGDENAWRDLAERAAEPNALCEADCVIPAARHQSFGDEISLVVAEEEGRFHACVPVRPVSNWYNIRYPVMANKVRRSTYVGTPLVDPTHGTTAVATLLACLADERRSLGYRLFGLDSLREGGPVAHHVHAAAAELGLPVYVHEDFERAMVVRRPEPTYLDDIDGTTRRNLGRRQRLALRELGSAPQLGDQAHDPSAVETFMDLEASGYKSENGVALATVPGEMAYFRDMCERFASAKNLVVPALRWGDRTLAMQVWLRAGDGLFAIKAAYDETFSRYGPGVWLHSAVFEQFHDATDARWLDTCSSPDNQFLMDLYPDRTRVTTLLFALGGPVDHLVVRSLPHVRAVHKRWISLRTPTGSTPGA